MVLSPSQHKNALWALDNTASNCIMLQCTKLLPALQPPVQRIGGNDLPIITEKFVTYVQSIH